MNTERSPRPTEELMRAASAMSAKQREVLAAVRGFPEGVLIDDLGAALGTHPNTVRGHLDDLVAHGVIAAVAVQGGGRGRPRLKYVARAPRRSSVTNEYVTLVEVLTDTLQEGDIDGARAVGRTWARAARGDRGDGEAATLLRDMGFAPRQREGRGELGLTACPGVTEAGRRPNHLICAMHEGFLREATGSDEVALTPFDRPGECGVHLAP